MLSQERQSLILDIIKEQGSVTVTRLTEILQSSESTVRRDLSYLASKGKINKVHGGATALGQEFIKLEDNIEEILMKKQKLHNMRHRKYRMTILYLLMQEQPHF